MKRQMIFDSKHEQLARDMQVLEDKGWKKDSEFYMHNDCHCVWMVKHDDDIAAGTNQYYADLYQLANTSYNLLSKEYDYLEKKYDALAISYQKLSNKDHPDCIHKDYHIKLLEENRLLKEQLKESDRSYVNPNKKPMRIDCPECHLALTHFKGYLICEFLECGRYKYKIIKTEINVGISQTIDPEKEKIIITKSAAIGMTEEKIGETLEKMVEIPSKALVARSKMQYENTPQFKLFDVVNALYKEFKLSHPTPQRLIKDLMFRWRFHISKYEIYVDIEIIDRQLFDINIFSNQQAHITSGKNIHIHTVKEVLQNSITAELFMGVHPEFTSKPLAIAHVPKKLNKELSTLEEIYNYYVDRFDLHESRVESSKNQLTFVFIKKDKMLIVDIDTHLETTFHISIFKENINNGLWKTKCFLNMSDVAFQVQVALAVYFVI